MDCAIADRSVLSPDSPAPPNPILDGAGFVATSVRPAVDGVDLTVHEGEIYGFLGINGAGKTTAIRLLMGIIAAESGTISLLGEVTRRPPSRAQPSTL